MRSLPACPSPAWLRSDHSFFPSSAPTPAWQAPLLSASNLNIPWGSVTLYHPLSFSFQGGGGFSRLCCVWRAALPCARATHPSPPIPRFVPPHSTPFPTSPGPSFVAFHHLVSTSPCSAEYLRHSPSGLPRQHVSTGVPAHLPLSPSFPPPPPPSFHPRPHPLAHLDSKAYCFMFYFSCIRSEKTVPPPLLFPFWHPWPDKPPFPLVRPPVFLPDLPRRLPFPELAPAATPPTCYSPAPRCAHTCCACGGWSLSAVQPNPFLIFPCQFHPTQAVKPP